MMFTAKKIVKVKDNEYSSSKILLNLWILLIMINFEEIYEHLLVYMN